MTDEEDKEVEEMSLSMNGIPIEPSKLLARLPRVSEIMNALKECSEEELRDTYLAPDGLRYHIRFNQMFVPPSLRGACVHWFHCGKYGGHYGINSTWKRMRRLMWWPHMKTFIRDFVSKCLACSRLRPVVGRTVRGVLERPVLFQLISLDCVGPIHAVGTSAAYIVVIVDHASRFVVTEVMWEPPTAKRMADICATRWCAYFGTPDMVLTDRGTEFTGSEFRSFVLEQMSARLLYTSPGYPEGNAINERLHQPLMHSVHARAAVEPLVPLADLVRDATLVYNATPKSPTGQSPFFCVTGREMRLPGLAPMVQEPSEEVRRFTLQELRNRAILKDQLKGEDFADCPEEVFAVGDVVLHVLTDYDRQQHPGVQQSAAMRFVPKWSLPSKIVEIKGKVALVRELWADLNTEPVQVPLRNLKRFSVEIPVPLRDEVWKQLEFERPQYTRKRKLWWRSFGEVKSIMEPGSELSPEVGEINPLPQPGPTRRKF